MQQSYNHRKMHVRFIVLALIVSLLMSLFGMNTVQASSTRLAIVEEVVGKAYVTKAGGKREFLIYTGMGLNQGDHIRTENHSHVQLALADREDYISILENTELYLSDLVEQGEKKKTGFSKWVGSVFAKVKSLFGTDDEFVIETPTAIMGVRGTHFIVGTDPETGDTYINVFAGIVASLMEDRNSQEPRGYSGTDIYPSQEAYFFNDMDGDETLPPIITFLDFDDFVDRVGEEVITTLLGNRDEIDDENERMIDSIRQGLREQGFLLLDDQGENSEEDLERLGRNLDYLIANIINNALENNRLDRSEVDRLIDELNRRNPDNPINLDKIPPFDPLRGNQVDEMEERKRELQEQRERQIAEQRERQREQQERNRDLLDELEQRRNEQQQQNQRAAEEERNRAQERYLDQLNEEQQRQFEERERQREAERQRAEEERQAREERARARENPPTPTRPTSPPTSPPTDPPTDPVDDSPMISLYTEFEADEDGVIDLSQIDGHAFKIQVRLAEISDLTGLQIHLISDPIFIPQEEDIMINQDVFGDSVIAHSTVFFNEEDDSRELLVAMITDANLVPVSISGESYIFEIEYYFEYGESEDVHTIKLGKVIAVDEHGEIIELIIENDEIKFKTEFPAVIID